MYNRGRWHRTCKKLGPKGSFESGETMSRDKRYAEDLSVEELEALLARKKVEARQERLQRFQRSGRAIPLPQRVDTSPSEEEEVPEGTGEDISSEDAPDEPSSGGWLRRVLNRSLVVVELAAVVGLAYILISGFGILRTLNQEVAEARSGATPSATPLITAVVLPSGHTPPTSPGGARPNEAEIPENLRPLVQSMPAPSIPTSSPQQAQRIHLPAIWESPAPVVQGDGWEQLKKGVGQHIGSVNPGDRGNMVLSAHNDIFGELFRDLDRLKPGDEIIVSTAVRDYVYKVTGLRIVEPTEVEVMEPTSKPTVTLISCYPYLIDNQRIVVFGELVEG